MDKKFGNIKDEGTLIDKLRIKRYMQKIDTCSSINDLGKVYCNVPEKYRDDNFTLAVISKYERAMNEISEKNDDYGAFIYGVFDNAPKQYLSEETMTLIFDKCADEHVLPIYLKLPENLKTRLVTLKAMERLRGKTSLYANLPDSIRCESDIIKISFEKDPMGAYKLYNSLLDDQKTEDLAFSAMKNCCESQLMELYKSLNPNLKNAKITTEALRRCKNKKLAKFFIMIPEHLNIAEISNQAFDEGFQKVSSLFISVAEEKRDSDFCTLALEKSGPYSYFIYLNMPEEIKTSEMTKLAIKNCKDFLNVNEQGTIQISKSFQLEQIFKKIPQKILDEELLLVVLSHAEKELKNTIYKSLAKELKTEKVTEAVLKNLSREEYASLIEYFPKKARKIKK